MKGASVEMKKWYRMVFPGAFLLCLFLDANAQEYTVTSPDGELEMKASVGETISYTVYHGGFEVISPSAVSMAFDNGISLGDNPQVLSTNSRSVDEVIYPQNSKNKEITDQFNELSISFEGNYQLQLRAYDEGVAYRFVTSFESDVVVQAEVANFNFSEVTSVIFPEADASLRSWERAYTRYSAIADIPQNKFSVTPVMFSYAGDLRVVIAEADQFDYPGMYLQHNDQGGMKGKWAHYPKEVSDSSDIYAYHRVLSRENFIAKTDGSRSYPWRVVIVEDDDKMLLNNQLIYKLATPSVLENTDWVKPGKSVWEWWHDAILETSAIPSGPENLSFDLYKYYVDLAADYNLEYITMDAGWSMDFAPQVIQYANEKGVEVILWDFINLPVENPARLLELKSIGAAGVKVDLIERDDQAAMQWIEQLARDCARQELVLVLHGCPKPSGWERTFPNIVNYEAVRGAETTKWDSEANPDYHLLFPFIRMLSGPLDYTPGSMRNVHVEDFHPIPHGIPLTMGTRVHELAMYVLYDQPVAYLCDSPTEYRKFPDIMRFFGHVPTTWDLTLPLEASVGEYAIVAKQSDDEWYVGAMTNADGRDIQIDLSFLEGSHSRTAFVYADSDQTEFIAESYSYEVISVDNTTLLDYHLSPGGGLVMRIMNDLVLGADQAAEIGQTIVWVDDQTSLNIESPGFIEQLRIVNLSGQVVANQSIHQPTKKYRYDISSLKDGVYLVEVVGPHYRQGVKFIKKSN